MVRMSDSNKARRNSMPRSLVSLSKVRQRGKLNIRNWELEVSMLRFMILLPRKGKL